MIDLIKRLLDSIAMKVPYVARAPRRPGVLLYVLND
jgi:hypothetical protein